MTGIPGSGAPFFSDYQNYLTALESPAMVHIHNTDAARYFRKYLYQKAISVFKSTFPANWNRDYTLFCIFQWGFVAVIETREFGIIPQGCGLQGQDVFYHPTHALITNHLLRGIIRPKIGVQTELIQLQPGFSGIADIVNYYGDLMALAHQSMTMNLLNSKLSYVFGVDSTAQSESFKAMYDDIQRGNPAVVYDKQMRRRGDGGEHGMWETFEQNVGSNFITPQLLTVMRTVEQMFDTDIGIPNANTEKRERLVVDEVNANNVETYTKAALWLETLREGCRKVNAMFGINCNFEWRIPPNILGGGSDGEAAPVNHGDVRL